MQYDKRRLYTSPCVSFDFLPHTPSLDGLLNLYSDLSSVFKLDIRSTENLPSLWQQPRASLLSMSQQLRVYTTSQKNASVFFTFFDIFLYLIPYNFLLNLGLYVETKKNQLVVKRRSHRYASFLRLAYEKIILRQYSRNLIFAVLVYCIVDI